MLGTLQARRFPILQSLEDAGCVVHKRAEQILMSPSFVIAPEETEIELVMLKPKATGLTYEQLKKIESDVFFNILCGCASTFGLTLCPPEVGLQLLLQGAFSPDGTHGTVVVAMQPVLTTGHVGSGIRQTLLSLVVYGDSSRMNHLQGYNLFVSSHLISGFIFMRPTSRFNLGCVMHLPSIPSFESL